MKKLFDEITLKEKFTTSSIEKFLESSTDLMDFLKTTLRNFNDISNGQPLFELFNLYRKYLSLYSNFISEEIPK
jgi:hypothetical protein